MATRAEEIVRRRELVNHGDAVGWESRGEERAAVQSLYDLLVHHAQMKTAHDISLDDVAELPVTHDREMLALAKRLAAIELANQDSL